MKKRLSTLVVALAVLSGTIPAAALPTVAASTATALSVKVDEIHHRADGSVDIELETSADLICFAAVEKGEKMPKLSDKYAWSSVTLTASNRYISIDDDLGTAAKDVYIYAVSDDGKTTSEPVFVTVELTLKPELTHLKGASALILKTNRSVDSVTVLGDNKIKASPVSGTNNKTWTLTLANKTATYQFVAKSGNTYAYSTKVTVTKTGSGNELYVPITDKNGNRHEVIGELEKGILELDARKAIAANGALTLDISAIDAGSVVFEPELIGVGKGAELTVKFADGTSLTLSEKALESVLDALDGDKLKITSNSYQTGVSANDTTRFASDTKVGIRADKLLDHYYSDFFTATQKKLLRSLDDDVLTLGDIHELALTDTQKSSIASAYDKLNTVKTTSEITDYLFAWLNGKSNALVLAGVNAGVFNEETGRKLTIADPISLLIELDKAISLAKDQQINAYYKSLDGVLKSENSKCTTDSRGRVVSVTLNSNRLTDFMLLIESGRNPGSGNGNAWGWGNGNGWWNGNAWGWWNGNGNGWGFDPSAWGFDFDLDELGIDFSGFKLFTTRATLALSLYKMAGSPEVDDDCDYKDIDDRSYYRDAVIWVTENDIMDGTDSRKFSPNSLVTVEELKEILENYAEYKGIRD